MSLSTSRWLESRSPWHTSPCIRSYTHGARALAQHTFAVLGITPEHPIRHTATGMHATAPRATLPVALLTLLAFCRFCCVPCFLALAGGGAAAGAECWGQVEGRQGDRADARQQPGHAAWSNSP